MKALGWHRELWNWLFWAGSFVASFFQGVMLGRYITGFESASALAVRVARRRSLRRLRAAGRHVAHP
jgi:cytochrome bd-type quinol oxidase subunit 2